MKKLIILAFAMVVILGCKSSQPSVSNDLVEVKDPCKEAVTGGDKKYFRANGTGESQSETVAREKAIMVARNFLASNVQTTVKTVTDRYTNSREMNTREDLEGKFEQLNREVVDQTLSGVRVICDKTFFSKSKGNYKSYVAVELSADDLVSKYKETLSKNEKIQIDYDMEKFRKEVFDELERRKSN